MTFLRFNSATYQVPRGGSRPKATTWPAALKQLLRICACLLPAALCNGRLASSAHAGEPSTFLLFTNAQTAGAGVFLDQLVGEHPALAGPPVRVMDAPAVGRVLVLTRAQVAERLAKSFPDLAAIDWTGAERVRITRRTRLLNEAEVIERLAAQLQKDLVRERGELELHLGRPWTPATIADETFTVKLIEVPSAGVRESMVVHFELAAGRETLGDWTVPVQAKLWRDVFVAKAPLKRGQPLTEDDLTVERRDVLKLREPLSAPLNFGGELELAESLAEGAPLSLRSVRLRPVVQRGQLVEAVVRDGPLQVSIRVEALESGAPGQLIRVRNPQSRREFRGKVQNEQTILVSL